MNFFPVSIVRLFYSDSPVLASDPGNGEFQGRGVGGTLHQLPGHGFAVRVDDPRRRRLLAVDHDVGPVALGPGRRVPEHTVDGMS